jgi:uncharacterized membrane protein
MNKKVLQGLYQELPELEARGIITPEISARIRQHYGEIKSVAKTTLALMICGLLGALLIGLGIILLLAHNWEQLSRLSRTVLSLAPLFIGQGFAAWVLWKKHDSGALKEGAATFLSLMVGASIALISQTYHISGDSGTFTLTWMFLIVPLVYLMRASLPAAFYAVGITVWSAGAGSDPLRSILFWPLSAVIVPHFIATLRQEAYGIRSTLLSLVMFICISFGVGFSLGRVGADLWVIVFPSFYAIVYSLGSTKFEGLTTYWQRPLRFLGTLSLLVLAFQFTFRFTWRYLGRDVYEMTRGISGATLGPDHFIVFAIVVAAVLLFGNTVKRGHLTNTLFSALPLCAIAGYLLRGQGVVAALLIFNAYLFCLSMGTIILGLRKNSLSAVNGGMLILAILVISRFFDSDINFVIKGMIFIIVGIGFLAANVMLMRRKGVGHEE